MLRFRLQVINLIAVAQLSAFNHRRPSGSIKMELFLVRPGKMAH
jgi:hypothetical protein